MIMQKQTHHLVGLFYLVGKFRFILVNIVILLYAV